MPRRHGSSRDAQEKQLQAAPATKPAASHSASSSTAQSEEYEHLPAFKPTEETQDPATGIAASSTVPSVAETEDPNKQLREAEYEMVASPQQAALISPSGGSPTSSVSGCEPAGSLRVLPRDEELEQLKAQLQDAKQELAEAHVRLRDEAEHRIDLAAQVTNSCPPSMTMKVHRHIQTAFLPFSALTK